MKDELLVINQIENYAIFTLDGYGQIASWNKGAQRLIGYEEEEVIGLPGSIVFIPEDVIRLEPEKEMSEATKKGMFETRRWHVGKYGMRFQAESSLTTLRNDLGEVSGFVKVLRGDNNQQQNAKEDGRFFTHAIDLFCIVSLDGQIKRVNPAFIHTLEPTTEELPSTNMFELVHPDDRDEVEAEFSKLMRGQPIKNIKHRFSVENGSSKRLVWAFFPDLTEKLAYGVGREISDLEEKEREPSPTIIEAVSNYLTDDFLATLSEELKDPLNTIRDFAELIMRTHHTSQIAQIRWAAEIIHRQAEAQARIIRDRLEKLETKI